MSEYTNPWLALAQPAAAAPTPLVRRPGALKKPKLSVGDVVHKWTLLEYLPGSQPGARGTRRPGAIPAKWRCQCTCGVIKPVQANNLHRGGSRSCGHDRDTSGYGHTNKP